MKTNLTNLRAHALNFTRHGVIITDAGTVGNPIIDVNPGFEVMTGYSREEVIGRDCNFLQGENTDKKVVQVLRKTIHEMETVRVTIQNYRKNGEAFWNELTISPIHDGGELIAYVGVQEDVTVEHVATELLATQHLDLEGVNKELVRKSQQRTTLDQRIDKLLKQSHL